MKVIIKYDGTSKWYLSDDVGGWANFINHLIQMGKEFSVTYE